MRGFVLEVESRYEMGKSKIEVCCLAIIELKDESESPNQLQFNRLLPLI